MNECNHAAELGAYLDGELSAEAQEQLQRHLMECSSCAAEVSRLRKLSQLIRSAEIPQISSAALGRLHKSTDRFTTSGIVRLAEALAGVAAVILLVCVLGLKFSPAAQGSSMPVWEMDALAPAEPAPSGSEELVASWMVEDLSGKEEHGQN